MIIVFECANNDYEIILRIHFRFIIVLAEIAMSNDSELLIQVLNYDQKSWIHYQVPLNIGLGSRSLKTTFPSQNLWTVDIVKP